MKSLINYPLRKVGSYVLGLAILAASAAGCKSMNKTQKGVAIGAAGGAVVGAGVGKAAGNTALGAIIGATVGGVTGGIIGRKMDKQAEEIDKIPGAEVKRVGEGINVTFDSGVLFGLDQSDLTPDARQRIRDLAGILNKYPDTYILIEGHTDNTGSTGYNRKLSKKRAASVADYLDAQAIADKRIKTAWYGEEQPKFSNETESERARNRRVEFAIYANDQMVEEAKKQAASTGQ